MSDVTLIDIKPRKPQTLAETRIATVIPFPTARRFRAIGLADTDPPVIRALRQKMGALSELEVEALCWYRDQPYNEIVKNFEDVLWMMVDDYRYNSRTIPPNLLVWYCVARVMMDRNSQQKWNAVYDAWKQEFGSQYDFTHIPAINGITKTAGVDHA